MSESTDDAHYLLSGSFKSTHLHLLSFSPETSTLQVVDTIAAKGPHQYLGLNKQRDRVYATSWANPSHLTAWSITNQPRQQPKLEFINQVPITSTSSYTFTTDHAIYSVGGPTGEIHMIDTKTGGLGDKIQELLYVPQHELASADKTRVALRSGSHAIEISSEGFAFVPHLGHNSIFMYSLEVEKHTLKFLSETKSPRENDGPRHVIVNPNGRFLYSMTEHSQFVDVFAITESKLQYVSSRTLLTTSQDPHHYRGETVRVSSHSNTLFATTRGANTTTPGILVVWKLDPQTGQPIEGNQPLRWPTPTSGGKSNAIELAPFRGRQGEELIVLTDDEQGMVFILSWNGKDIEQVAMTNLGEGEGASHAVWLA